MGAAIGSMLREAHPALGDILILEGRRRRAVFVPDHMRDCVCFAYIIEGGVERPVGTAFAVSTPLADTGRRGGVLVTALHLVAKAKARSDDGCLYMRLNTHAGGYQFVKIEPDAWEAPDQSELTVDVAVCPWDGDGQFSLRTVGVGQCATTDAIATERIGVGTDVFLTGLFVNHHGRERNVPIVRVGNIAAMPQEPVKTKLGLMDAFLVEARSVGGLSGSPVFVNLGLVGPDGEHNLGTRSPGSQIWYLLGIMHGHWDAQADDVVVDDGISTEYVNMGIAIVTPITAVLDLLDTPPLSERFDAMTKKAESAQLPTMDAADERESETGDEFERFEDLTRKLVQTPKPEIDEKRRE